MTSTAATTSPDCIGPVAIPLDTMRALHALARSASADDFVALSACAWVLASQPAAHSGTPRVQVIQDPYETITPACPAPAESFRALLSRTSDRPFAATGGGACEHVDTTVLISADGTRLYVETTSGPADEPAAQLWAATFVRLLVGLIADPDAPLVATEPGGVPDARPPFQ